MRKERWPVNGVSLSKLPVSPAELLCLDVRRAGVLIYQRLPVTGCLATPGGCKFPSISGLPGMQEEQAPAARESPEAERDWPVKVRLACTEVVRCWETRVRLRNRCVTSMCDVTCSVPCSGPFPFQTPPTPNPYSLPSFSFRKLCS